MVKAPETNGLHSPYSPEVISTQQGARPNGNPSWRIYNATSATWPNNLGILEVYENQTQDFQKMKALAEKLTTWTKNAPSSSMDNGA